MAEKESVRPEAEQNAVNGGGEFTTFALEDAEDNRILRSSLWVAAGFHALLLMINFPAFESQTQAAPENPKVFRVSPPPRWKPPEVPKTALPPKQVKRVPVPDETPRDPEPIRLDEPRAEIDLPDVDPADFVIPEAPPEPDPVGPIPVGGEVTKPEKIFAPMPAYTEIARRARIQGVVIVQAVIDKEGNVTDLEVLKSLPMGLTEAAVNAIERWKFEPATLRGKPVAVYYNLTVSFYLQ